MRGSDRRGGTCRRNARRATYEWVGVWGTRCGWGLTGRTWGRGAEWAADRQSGWCQRAEWEGSGAAAGGETEVGGRRKEPDTTGPAAREPGTQRRPCRRRRLRLGQRFAVPVCSTCCPPRYSCFCLDRGRQGVQVPLPVLRTAFSSSSTCTGATT